MARGRMLSKTLSCSRRFNALPEIAGDLAEFSQLLYALLLPHVDDFGRMTADPFSVKLTVLPASGRPPEDFAAALFALHESELLTVYEEKADIWLQVNKFDEHQIGLHKRTESKIPSPGNSRKFPEIPGDSGKFLVARARGTELKGTELKGTEGKGTEGKIPELENKLVRKAGAGTTSAKKPTSARSKHPIFSGQRLTVFEWMLEDCINVLGAHTDDFDLHAWFFQLDAEAVRVGLVIPKRDGGAWLQLQLVSEAQRRGLPISMATVTSRDEARTQANIAAFQEFVAKGKP